LNIWESNLWDCDAQHNIFPNAGLDFSSFGELSLDLIIPDCREVEEIIGETGEEIFGMGPVLCSNP
jgi:hypothetical protein